MRTLKGSIKKTLTGEVFETELTPFRLKDIGQIKKADWQFNWEREVTDKQKRVIKLTIIDDPETIYVLLSIGDNIDHILMYLIESADFNKGKRKLYEGIPGNLIAYACKLSFDLGYEGYVMFYAKSRLIKHYEETLGARSIGGLKMILDSKAALR
ncbi:MAG: hypothetical protein KF870_07655 [Leadbetterella sp.]|nr:hypothetical protein [Leadbetterella sp.]